MNGIHKVMRVESRESNASRGSLTKIPPLPRADVPDRHSQAWLGLGSLAVLSQGMSGMASVSVFR